MKTQILLLVMTTMLAPIAKASMLDKPFASTGDISSTPSSALARASDAASTSDAPQIDSIDIKGSKDADGDNRYHVIESVVNISPGKLNSSHYLRMYLVPSDGAEELVYTSEILELPVGSNYQYRAHTTLLQSRVDEPFKLRAALYTPGLAEPVSDFTSDLLPIKLESRDADLAYHPSHSIASVDTFLFGDSDYDGHFRIIKVDVDADTVYAADTVYLKFLLRDDYGEWWSLFTTGDFIIHGDSTHDRFFLSVELPAHFYFGYYDLRVELFSSTTHEFLVAQGPSSAQSNLPLESYADDTAVSVHVGASASGLGLFAGLLLLTALRRGFAKFAC